MNELPPTIIITQLEHGYKPLCSKGKWVSGNTVQLQDLILNRSHEESCLRNSMKGTRSDAVNPHREVALPSDGETCTLSLQGTKDQSKEPAKDQRAPLTPESTHQIAHVYVHPFLNAPLTPKSKGFKEQKHPMGHPDPGGGFAVRTQPSKAMKTPRDGQFLPGRSQLRASTSCHPQVHSKAAFSLCPDWLQHPRLSAAPTRPGQRVSLPTHWALLSASKGMGHTGSCTGSDPRSAWTASRHESSPRQVPWEKHKVRTSTY